ncbi:hypothetical protein GQX74_002377 [Glossina fuscipes]|nr:hypothetical protein GQX74_002377 [Glossina fuscipes]
MITFPFFVFLLQIESYCNNTSTPTTHSLNYNNNHNRKTRKTRACRQQELIKRPEACLLKDLVKY